MKKSICLVLAVVLLVVGGLMILTVQDFWGVWASAFIVLCSAVLNVINPVERSEER